MIKFIKINNSKDIKGAFDLIKASLVKKLVINVLQETRELEGLFDIQDYIIYNSYDYFSGMVEFEKASIEVDDDFLWLASSHKLKEDKLNVDRLLNLDLEFDNIFIVYTDKIKDNFTSKFLDLFTKSEIITLPINNEGSNLGKSTKDKDISKENIFFKILRIFRNDTQW